MVEMDISPRALRLMQDALRTAGRTSKATSDASTKKAAWHVARSMSAAVKPKSLNAKRELVSNPERQRGGRQAKKAIKVLSQVGPARYLPTRVGASDRRRKIKRMGLASASFRFTARKFGKKQSGRKVPGASKHGYGVFKSTRTTVRASIVSSLSYVAKVYPSAADQALKKGLTSFVRTFDRDWATALKRQKWA